MEKLKKENPKLEKSKNETEKAKNFPKWIMKVDDDQLVLFPEVERLLYRNEDLKKFMKSQYRNQGLTNRLFYKDFWDAQHSIAMQNFPMNFPCLFGIMISNRNIMREDPLINKWGDLTYFNPLLGYNATSVYPKYAQGAVGYFHIEGTT